MRFLTQPWSKKRGSRNLGGGVSSTVGEVAFFAVLFLVGVFGLSLVLINRFAPANVPANLPQTDAMSTPLGTWVLVVLCIVAIATGVASLVYRLMRFGTSNEYRSVLASRAGKIEQGAIELIGPSQSERVSAGDDLSRLPSVPRGQSLTDSPGERLAYRLAAENPSSSIAGPATLSLLWNSVWFVLLAVAVSGFWHSRPRWILTLLLVPFAMIGYWAFKYFLAQLRQTAGVGPTIVEISQHPLYPGETYQLVVQQMGRMKLKRLSVQLSCEEETFYRQGTDVRVEKHESFVQVLCRERDVSVDPRHGWEQQLELALPADVMHSFVGTHNAIRWKIVVSGESRPWPSFCRSFPVVVYPQGLPPKRSPR
jgi:hypothetical protein